MRALAGGRVKVRTYSLGMKQRLGLAAASPRLLGQGLGGPSTPIKFSSSLY